MAAFASSLAARARRLLPSDAAGWVELIAVVGVAAVVLREMHPSLLLANTTTDGGDTGAHVMLPAFMRSNLLPHFRLTGWSPSWYAGFPIFTFYFPLPPLVVDAIALVAPYNVAFKLVTVLGSVMLPLACWAFGRLARLPRPIPAALAAFSLPFLFESSFSIDGGNLLSTLAGEYSFSLALPLALVFLGLVVRGIRTPRRLALAAVLLGATLLCHLVVAIWAVVGATLWVAMDRDVWRIASSGLRGRLARRRWSRRALWVVGAGVLSALLTAWWLVPFDLEQVYTTNMGWTNVAGFPHLLFPASSRWIDALALVGALSAIVRRIKPAVFLGLLTGISAATVCLDPQGKLYNVRFLPLWFLGVYLMGGVGVAAVASLAVRSWRRHQASRWARWARAASRSEGPAVAAAPRRPGPATGSAGRVVGGLLAVAVAAVAVLPPLVFSSTRMASIGITVSADQPSAWATWNFTGYQRQASYPEYEAVVGMMAKVGREQGCGRAMWEYDPSLNRFGTTMALMLLPYWTGGCVDSMEGLLFESSTTTPFHFLNQSELSATPSDAMVGLPYAGLDVALGVEHLQMLGVRYLLVSSSTVEQALSHDPSVHLLASTGPWSSTYEGSVAQTTWEVFEVARSSPVVALSDQPVVWTGVGPAQTSWLAPAVAWYQDPTRWYAVPTAGGPPGWQRIRASVTHPTAVHEPAVTVSHIRTNGGTISFDVSRTGVPVEVRTSYFPNWQASGAQGPWRAAPNLMVVVPTSRHVTLHYGYSRADVLGWVLTAVGTLILVACVLAGRRKRFIEP